MSLFCCWQLVSYMESNEYKDCTRNGSKKKTAPTNNLKVAEENIWTQQRLTNKRI